MIDSAGLDVEVVPNGGGVRNMIRWFCSVPFRSVLFCFVLLRFFSWCAPREDY